MVTRMELTMVSHKSTDIGNVVKSIQQTIMVRLDAVLSSNDLECRPAAIY